MIIKQKLKNLSTSPGVYQMLDNSNKVIYIGKAKNLKKRVSQYFSNKCVDRKTMALITNIKNFEVIVTSTETQALLLENELIKQHNPKYNVLLKDAKSYPYICITNDKHPRVGFYRGVRKESYNFFGPYPSANMVRESLTVLKKIFKVRQCSNSFYRVRSRPCLEYQIGLCSAPCVGKIIDKNYLQDVNTMALFLSGKHTQTLQVISKKMQQASKNLDFELAGYYRDQLIGLRTIQEQHTSQKVGDMDVVSIAVEDGIYGVEVLFIRKGKQIGQEFIVPKNSKASTMEDVLTAFLPLYYLGKFTPRQILVNSRLNGKKLLSSVLSTNIISIANKDKKHFLHIANLTVRENLKQYIISNFTKYKQLLRLQKVLALQAIPTTMECFDISHISGEATVASCVVFEKGLAKTNKYRCFNIKNIIPGDDYAAINQVIYRRYSRLKKENKPLPDIVFVDGGLGQLRQATMVFDSIGVKMLLVAIAKAKDRKSGFETLIMIDNGKVKKINLMPNDLALLLVNNIRDEAHRFALKNHRKKRSKKFQTSILEGTYGIGKLRKIALLNYFGSLAEIKKASIDELQKVVGINAQLALRILENLRK